MADEEVIARVIAGDLEAFAVLVGRYHPGCLRYARRLLGSPEAAEEAVQDTFVRVFRSLGNYDHRDQFEAWIFRILVNRCRTAGAREKRRTSTVSAVASRQQEPAPGATPDPLRRRRIDAALARLSQEKREAFLLKYVEELSYEEMARMTGVSIPALKMRVQRARDELKRLLEPDHDF
jgi:RNA polymerase sigma-70 factor (ECF subfamily)